MSDRRKSSALALSLLALVVAVGVGLYSHFAPRPEMDDAAFGEKVRAYLLANPTVLRDAMIAYSEQEENLAAAEREALLAQFGDQLLNDGYSHVAGNPSGDVTIVEFFDYRCGYCKAAFPNLMKAIEEDGNTRLVLKELPILGPGSTLAAQAAIAAGQQGGYMALHNALMESRGELTMERILNIATDAGLDPARLKADMGSERTAEIITKNLILSDALGISGTPAFIIGNNFIPGAISLDEFREVIAYVRAQAAAKGTPPAGRAS